MKKNLYTMLYDVYLQCKEETLRPTYFLLALAVLSLNLSFFGVSDSFSLESAEEGESGESRRNLSSLRAWILWGVGGPVWGLEQSSVTAEVVEVGVVGADTVVDVSELTEGTAV